MQITIKGIDDQDKVFPLGEITFDLGNYVGKQKEPVKMESIQKGMCKEKVFLEFNLTIVLPNDMDEDTFTKEMEKDQAIVTKSEGGSISESPLLSPQLQQTEQVEQAEQAE